FLESLLVNFRGQILKLPITPYNWTKISEIDRANLINEQVFLNDQNLNLQLNIREREEIFEIAEAFSGSISSEDIAEYLLKKWETKSNIPLRVNALEILPPFMQYAYGNFSETGGPNCFNCAINSKRQSAFHVEYNDKEELKRHLSQYYRPMTEYEIPQVGDLIIYYKKNKSPIHAANYLPFDLAFSKNGINKFASYQIQDLDTLNATYKYSGNITAKYYRLKKPEILHLNIRQSQTSCSSSAFIE
ncbi:MAG: hypothetical protein VX642_00040, partial [Bdellovibrionota bacterium]|nr:hypothetical protein [Bdellovibrionota bacterium]